MLSTYTMVYARILIKQLIFIQYYNILYVVKQPTWMSTSTSQQSTTIIIIAPSNMHYTATYITSILTQ